MPIGTLLQSLPTYFYTHKMYFETFTVDNYGKERYNKVQLILVYCAGSEAEEDEEGQEYEDDAENDSGRANRR